MSRRIYLLSPSTYSPEIIAVSFAKTSRSPRSFKETADELNDSSSSEFHEKWVVGYGHSSVAEHAVLHIAVEGISRLATEEVESCRLASYTEKSSRYQVFNKSHYYTPEVIVGSDVEGLYHKTISQLFDLYQETIEPFKQLIMSQMPIGKDEDKKSYESRIRSKYIDNSRYLIPAAALTNLGITINARSLEHTLSKMLSSNLQEVREIAVEIKNATLAEVPTLIKYAAANSYIQTQRDYMRKVFLNREKPGMSGDQNRIISIISNEEENVYIDKLLAAFITTNTQLTSEECFYLIEALTIEEKQNIIKSSLASIGPRDNPPKELEHIGFTLEGLLDQGAYYDIKRHRMTSQSSQMLNANLGYTMPKLIVSAGLEKKYIMVMEQVVLAYKAIACQYPDIASYVVPNAFRRRLIMSLNFREAFIFCRLRSAKNGHPAYRRFALALKEALKEKYPFWGSLITVNDGQTFQEITEEFFACGYE